MKTKALLVLLSLLTAFTSCKNDNVKIKRQESMNPSISQDCIHDSADAVKIALINLEKKFGKEIFDYTPLSARVVGDTSWLVSCSNKSVKNPSTNTITFGGFISILLRKIDCSVIEIYVNK